MSPVKIIQKVISEFHSDGDSSESLNLLMEFLENKEDPDAPDIILIDSIHQYLEKKKLLETHLKSYVKNYYPHKNKLEEILNEINNQRDWDL